MNPNGDKNYVRIKKTVIIIAVLVLVAGLLGWYIGQSKNSSDDSTNAPRQNSEGSSANKNNEESSVGALVRYSLPDGWKEATCPDAINNVYILPRGQSEVDCGGSPDQQIKISLDSANNKDCNQLQNVQNVSKHICISEFINGQKSLKAETIYNNESSYKKETTINAYYIDTGKGVVKVEYVHTSGNEYQAGFEELAKSVQAK